MIRCACLLLLAGVARKGFAQTSSPVSSPSLCHSGEQIYLSCTVEKGAKQLALCGRGDDSRATPDNYLQYRYGTKNRIELLYPVVRSESIAKFEQHTIYQKTARTSAYEIHFRNGQFEYVVYSYQHPAGDDERDGYISDAGVRVARDGKALADIRCETSTIDQLIQFERLR